MMTVSADSTFIPPGVGDFFPPAIIGGITKPMVLLVLSVVLILAFFLIAMRSPRILPGKLQFAAESVYDLGRDTIAREQIGGKDFKPYVPLIVSLFTFILVNNLFSVIPLIQFPTMAHTGFPLALLIVLYPLFHYVGIKRHGLFRYCKNQLFPPDVPKPDH